MICIVCSIDHQHETVEHIVPRSLGNIHYILSKGKVCATCNNRFARFENTVLNTKEIYKERAARGLTRSRRHISKKSIDNGLVLFMVKLAYEGMMLSRPQLLDDSQQTELKEVLMQRRNHSYQVHKDKRLLKDYPIPRFMDRFRLRRNGINLSYSQTEGQLWFQFGYGKLNYVLRLI